MNVLRELLEIEHQSIAYKLGMLDSVHKQLNYSLAVKALGYIDQLSRRNPNEKQKKEIITISALLWTYRNELWTGLRDTLTLTLSRIGYAPSSVMVDLNYDKENKLFSRMNSLQSEISVLLDQIQYEVKVGSKFYLLTEFQLRVWNAIEQNPVLGISAPTSAGKSFVISLKIADTLLHNDGCVVYIVPTLSLVSQVCQDLQKQLENAEVSDFCIATNCENELDYNKKIFVLTQEKAINAFSSETTSFENIQMLVVDEIQNLERSDSEDDSRSKILYDVLINFRCDCNLNRVIISGPRIENIKDLGIKVFCNPNTEEIETKSSPVVNLTYSIENEGHKRYFKQYSDLVNHPNKIDITSISIPDYSGSAYRKTYLNDFRVFFDKLKDDNGNLIFAPTSSTAVNIASALVQNEPAIESDKINSLVTYIKTSVRDNYCLAKCVSHGIAYHHGRVPMHVRNVVEYAVKNNIVPNVICTTTLMQGVNLPAKNIIMRNPFLCVKSSHGKKAKLTNYELANLRGRAGRLMSDFIGRTYVLAENEFDKDNDQTELFQETKKTIEPGYGNVYENNKAEINSALINAESTLHSENAFLITYIRQIVYKYGDDSQRRLAMVGIDLSDSEIGLIRSTLHDLSVPVKECEKNRYWDPFDLDRIYVNKNSYSLPNRVFVSDLAGKMKDLLLQLQIDFPFYYDKYFEKIENDFLFQKRMQLTASWMREKKLPEMLSDNFFDNPHNIDDALSFLQNKVSYGLSMLLKPFYDIIDPDCGMVQIIEMGANRPITKKIMGLNVPREVAISLCDRFFSSEEDLNESQIRERIQRNKNNLDFWEKVQLENI